MYICFSFVYLLAGVYLELWGLKLLPHCSNEINEYPPISYLPAKRKWEVDNVYNYSITTGYGIVLVSLLLTYLGRYEGSA
jgi:hypothetical protein